MNDGGGGGGGRALRGGGGRGANPGGGGIGPAADAGKGGIPEDVAEDMYTGWTTGAGGGSMSTMVAKFDA